MDSQPALQPAVLEVLIPGTRPALDVFGAWQGRPASQAVEGVGAVWRADLPEDDAWAGQLLSAQAQRLHAAVLALPAAEKRLAVDLAVLAAGPPDNGRVGGAAFGSISGAAEGGTQAWQVLQTARQFSLQAQGLSFSTDQNAALSTAELAQAGDRFEHFMSQLKNSVGQLELVQTSSGGSPLATSRVDWLGNIETWWAAGRRPERSALHTSVLRQALLTRQNWLRFALLVTGGAVRVGAALASGPFGLLSLWTTWNYIQRVIDEFRRLGSSGRG